MKIIELLFVPFFLIIIVNQFFSALLKYNFDAKYAQIIKRIHAMTIQVIAIANGKTSCEHGFAVGHGVCDSKVGHGVCDGKVGHTEHVGHDGHGVCDGKVEHDGHGVCDGKVGHDGQEPDGVTLSIIWPILLIFVRDIYIIYY
jgi:hypothetical protein